MSDRSEAKKIIKQINLERKRIKEAQKIPAERHQEAVSVYAKCVSEMVLAEIDKMPIVRIKEVTKGNMRLGILESSGYKTVGNILRANQSIKNIHGIGPNTAKQVISAAHNMKSALENELRFRFSPDGRSRLQEKLLGALLSYDEAETLISSKQSTLNNLISEMEKLLSVARPVTIWFHFYLSSWSKKQLIMSAVYALQEILSSPSLRTTIQNIYGLQEKSHLVGDKLWHDYEQRPVYYNKLLEKIGVVEVKTAVMQGNLLPDVANRISKYPLDISLMHTSLRGYQAFGAKFALFQKRVIIGDEMGLGKTLQALAAISDLSAKDNNKSFFVVVCPASVIVNWVREVEKHTALKAYQLHGMERKLRYDRWLSSGGIAVVTFHGIQYLVVPEWLRLKMLIIDEAHYIKNPTTQRAKSISIWTKKVPFVLFLTGTPMENKLLEFKSLVEHLDSSLGNKISSDSLPGSEFRRIIAPVYLRREQKDVLSELPDRVESNEWVEFDRASLEAYKSALREGNFMAMRQAAYLSEKSPKIQRIIEIINEAEGNMQHVVIFSYFLNVLHLLHNKLGARSVGIISGSVNPTARQALVDSLENRRTPSVLISQINAGGVGLNIQAASLVILAEPQWTPSLENQAIARCHRMGQKRTVMVYRMLTENSVDQRMVEILRTKTQLFDQYARNSELRDATMDAIDVTDMGAVQKFASHVQEEKQIIIQEKIRLGIA